MQEQSDSDLKAALMKIEWLEKQSKNENKQNKQIV